MSPGVVWREGLGWVGGFWWGLVGAGGVWEVWGRVGGDLEGFLGGERPGGKGGAIKYKQV